MSRTEHLPTLRSLHLHHSFQSFRRSKRRVSAVCILIKLTCCASSLFFLPITSRLHWHNPKRAQQNNETPGSCDFGFTRSTGHAQSPGRFFFFFREVETTTARTERAQVGVPSWNLEGYRSQWGLAAVCRRFSLEEPGGERVEGPWREQPKVQVGEAVPRARAAAAAVATSSGGTSSSTPLLYFLAARTYHYAEEKGKS